MSAAFGTLTLGRQRALGTDTMLVYDPAGGSYPGSMFIGGQMGGVYRTLLGGIRIARQKAGP